MTKEVDFLYLEDNEDYCHFIDKAVQTLEKPVSYIIVNEGQQALNSLNGISEVTIEPKVIFLDINLGDASGIDILKEIRQTTNLVNTPVIMLTSSESPKDVNQSLRLGANAYVVKPSSYKRLKELLADSSDFWLRYHLPNLKRA